MTRLLVRLYGVLALVLSGLTYAADETDVPHFQPADDWEWLIEPTNTKWTAMATNGMLFRIESRSRGDLLVVLAYSDESLKGSSKIRPVAFDVKNERHELAFDSAVSSGGATMSGYVIAASELPGGTIAHVGVERITTTTMQDVIAPRAFDALKGAGVDALPVPVVGQPYEFELTTIDGKRIHSRDLLGKVVMLDFWAGWCKPCMEALPVFVEAYTQLKKDGLELVGINMDFSADDAHRLVTEKSLPWPNALAPTDDAKRALWQEAAGVGGIPHVILLDRKGIVVRNETGVRPEAIVQQLTELVAE